jgi:hypothetical protein
LESIIKSEFLRRILEEQKSDLQADQDLALRKFIQFRTGRTFANRIFSTSFSAQYLSGAIHYTGGAHIRFLDIDPKRRKSNTDGKRRWIYNRRIEHIYLRTARRVMFGLTREVAEGIKRQLQIN